MLWKWIQNYSYVKDIITKMQESGSGGSQKRQVGLLVYYWEKSPVYYYKINLRLSFCLFRRILIITLVGAVYLSMWGSYLYFNGTVTDGDGEEIPIHEALHHFFTSPWWTDVKNSLYEVYLYAQHHGW